MTEPRFLPGGYSDSDDFSDNSDFFYDEFNSSHNNKSVNNNHHEDEAKKERDRRIFGPGNLCSSINDSKMSNSNCLDDLHECILAKDVAKFKERLGVVEDVDKIVLPGWNGGSLLMVASANVCCPIVRFLVEECGANVGRVDGEGLTPLHALAGAQNVDEEETVACAKILINASSSSDLANRVQCQRLTPLMLASRAGNASLVSFLVEHAKAELDTVDTSGYSALCFAAERGYGQIVRILIENGCNVNILDRDGRTAADLASNCGHENIKDLIDCVTDKKALLRCREQRGFRTFSQLENVLLSLDVDEESMEALRKNEVTDLKTFLVMNEQDLEAAGITKVGLRKKLAAAIADMHKEEWQRSSVPVVATKDRQRGIRLTCPDCILMSANLTQHITLMTASVQFMRTEIVKHPELLALGQDVGDVRILVKHVENLNKQVDLFNRHLGALSQELENHVSKDYLVPADRLQKKRSMSIWPSIAKLSAGMSLTLITAFSVVWIVRKSITK